MIITPGMLNRRAEFYHQLSATISAGVPLIGALEMAGAKARGERKIIPALLENLRAGHTFSESMVQAKGWIPEFDVALLSVGEKSGRLDASFRLLADYYGTRAKIIRDTISDLIITIATLHVFLLIFPLNLFVACVLGFFNNQYSQCIPFLVEKGIVFGSIYAAVFFLIYACQGKRGEHWRSFVEQLVQMIPILRTAQKYLALSRLSAALEALINAGVSIISSWELAATAGGSPLLKRVIAKWPPEFESGKTPAELVNRSPYFPDIFQHLYFTGETSGKLDETLNRLRVYFQEEGFRKLRVFTRIMNGTIYGLVVMLVAWNVLHFYMGYYSGIMNTFSP